MSSLAMSLTKTAWNLSPKGAKISLARATLAPRAVLEMKPQNQRNALRELHELTLGLGSPFLEVDK
jgi:hypothetical protein